MLAKTTVNPVNGYDFFVVNILRQRVVNVNFLFRCATCVLAETQPSWAVLSAPVLSLFKHSSLVSVKWMFAIERYEPSPDEYFVKMEQIGNAFGLKGKIAFYEGCSLLRFIYADTKGRLAFEEQAETMNNMAERLLELDVRHGELLDKLVCLDQKIDDVLKEWTAVKEARPELSENRS